MGNDKKQSLQDMQAMMRVMNMEEKVAGYEKQLDAIALEAVSKGAFDKLAFLTAVLAVTEKMGNKETSNA
ncbi:hypothetical protein Vid5_gp88 [Pantoea phage vB_PagS_Vid5]|uniref:Uncharacterized protein n=1 Tax=Pantoea phage vB_PagS_Vid5 TaxID=2099652 RepID=A0A2P1CKR9_9CAUD|nr:hypothetical protein FDJ45_gp067 [Pantoea phage vB_PagS_Vid5]AVJ51843.1 hypothetical protein Vid5_gp88 [Pantoea phage vB_PagS_Vid5]